MDKQLIAYCGICEWKDKTGCKGGKANNGVMFWGGECDKAQCCIEKGLKHCGEYAEMPCKSLKELFDDPEHGDKGARLCNLQNFEKRNL